jgi:hypothetical protein
MTTTKESFGTANQSVTCTINSLASAAARMGTAISNATTLYLDVLVMAEITAGAASTAATGTCVLYAAGSVDGGTTYTENAVGTDGALTLVVPTNLRIIGVVNVVANNGVYYGGPFSVAAAFGGILPQYFNLVFLNSSGGTLAAAGNSLYYQGINLTNA